MSCRLSRWFLDTRSCCQCRRFGTMLTVERTGVPSLVAACPGRQGMARRHVLPAARACSKGVLENRRRSNVTLTLIGGTWHAMPCHASHAVGRKPAGQGTGLKTQALGRAEGQLLYPLSIFQLARPYSGHPLMPTASRYPLCSQAPPRPPPPKSSFCHGNLPRRGMSQTLLPSRSPGPETRSRPRQQRESPRCLCPSARRRCAATA